MRKSLFAGAATVLALSFGVVACGSDDSDKSGGSNDEPTLTKAQVIEQADSICTQFNAEVQTKASKLKADAGQEEVLALISDDIVPMYRDEITDLRELNPDEETSAQFNEILDTLESELNKVEEDPTLIFSTDSAFPEATKQAKEFGLKVCGSGAAS